MVKPYFKALNLLKRMKNCPGQAVIVVGLGLLLAGALSYSGKVFAEEKAAVKKMRTGIIFETMTIDPEVFTRVQGAKKTVMVAVHEWDYGVKLFTAKQWRETGYDNAEFRSNAEAVADAVMEKVKPELLRDSHGVVLYAVIKGEDPFLSSILLSSKFLPKFAKTLGESLLVVILDRQVIYVFPELGGRLDEFGAALAGQYQETKQPVSLEILKVNKKGIQVIGNIERR